MTSSLSRSVMIVPDRHAQHDVVGRGAELVGAPTGLTVARLVAARIAVVDQGVEVAVGDGEDAARRARHRRRSGRRRDELFAAEAHAAGSAVAGGHVDGGFIYEFHGGRC
jgi:hypothetical protein